MEIKEELMKYLFILIFLLPFLIFGQVINHTWGYTTAGVAYTQTGTGTIDSIATTNIVFDLQDYSYLDWNPLALDSVTALYNSDALFIGTFWYRIDLQNATDSSSVRIEANPGFMIYHPNDGSRITTTNLNFSTTDIALQDSGTHTTNDIQWTPLNVYLSATTKVLPPEFIKINILYSADTNDSLSFYWDFVYPATSELNQDHRTTTRSQGEARKEKSTLH